MVYLDALFVGFDKETKLSLENGSKIFKFSL